MKNCVYEQISEQEQKSSIKWRDLLKCKKCGMPMVASARPTGTKWDCSEVYCYHSFFEANK